MIKNSKFSKIYIKFNSPLFPTALPDDDEASMTFLLNAINTNSNISIK